MDDDRIIKGCDGEDYRLADLKATIDRITDPSDWKGPIDTVCDGDDLGIVCEAIRFYTATEPMATLQVPVRYPVRYAVKSEGYRLGPAGP